jgi:hypothetical protein
MDYDDFPASSLWPGMLLMNVPGVPNVVGPDAEFDNRIVKIAWDGEIKRLRCQVMGVRYTTETFDEFKEKLPEWEFIRELENVKDVGPQDYLNQ